MRWRGWALALCVLFSIGLHGYLALHFYPVRYASTSEASLCNVNATFNCDAVAASPYSQVMGLPLSILGLTANALFLVLLALQYLGLTDNPARTLRYALYFSLMIAGMSVLMGLISLAFMTVYCLFCILLYLFSFAQMELTRRIQDEPIRRHWRQDLTEALSFEQAWRVAAYLAAIPLLSFLFHAQALVQYGVKDMNALIAESRFRWQNSPVFDFSKVAPSLTKGAGNNAEVVLVEFADFLCPHCKTAATTLGAFVKTRPNVRLDFFAFPLDGACNASIPEATSSLRCWLAGAVYCGGKLEPAASGGSNWGWRLQEEFFQGQSTWGGLRAREDFEKQLIGLTGPDVGARLIACLADPSTTEALRAQAKVGAEAGVKGTPAIFINGRRVMAGQYLSVLEDIYARSK